MLIHDPDLDIAESGDDLLVNLVNTRGVMGAGVAKALADRHPEILEPYRDACRLGRLRPGRVQVLRLADGRRVVNMATKEDWRGPSRLDWVGAGLVRLNRLLCETATDVRRVTLPPPGCGHGGLPPARVLRMVRVLLAPALARGVQVRITAPEPAPLAADPVAYAGVGARKTPAETLALMRAAAARLAARGCRLRSGEAIGADTAFRLGAEDASGPREIFTARPRPDIAASLDGVTETHLDMVDGFHPAPRTLSGFARRLMARNGAQVFGLDFAAPSDVVLCWTPNGGGTGGTGQAIRLAASVGIPVLDLGRPELAGIDAERLTELAVAAALERRRACGLPCPASPAGDGRPEP